MQETPIKKDTIGKNYHWLGSYYFLDFSSYLFFFLQAIYNNQLGIPIQQVTPKKSPKLWTSDIKNYDTDPSEQIFRKLDQQHQSLAGYLEISFIKYWLLLSFYAENL